MTPGGATLDSRCRQILELLLPVLVVGGVLAAAIGVHLHDYGGNLTGFVQFGSYFAKATRPPHGAVVLSGSSRYGYDGQFYYAFARDPLLLHDSTLKSFGGEAFRSWRVAYPAVAFLLSGGQQQALPAALLAVNVAVVLALTAAFAVYARRRGWSPLWALAVGLLPGFLLATLRDLTDPLAAATAIGGLLAWNSRRRVLAASLLTFAVLGREVMILAVVAVALEVGIGAWRSRTDEGAVRRRLRDAWPVLAVPTAAFICWQVYVAARYGTLLQGAGTTKPFVTFIYGIRDASRLGSSSSGAWDIAYELLILAATAAAVLSMRRRLSVLSIGAVLLALSVAIGRFSPIWGDTRDSLPVFALLLVIGLENRSRLNLSICVAAAAMTALIPVAIPGIFPA
jgi:hypothetical protein